MAIWQVRAIGTDIVGEVILADRVYRVVTGEEAATRLGEWVKAELINERGDVVIRARKIIDVND